MGGNWKSATIKPEGLHSLIGKLRDEAYRVVGPTMRDDAIVYDDIAGLDDLPKGWTDDQEAGRYALARRSDDAYFGYNVGPHSWKQFLFPPVETMWHAQRDEDGAMTCSAPSRPKEKFAFVGVRACEIHAIAIQDRVFREGPFADNAYASRRQDAFIIAVNCGQAGATCFCSSMGTGPRADGGFDLALTELLEGGDHRFLVEIGSEAGAAIMEAVPHAPASSEQVEAAAAIVEETANRMGRSLETDGLKELLQGNLDHPRWNDVADRCLTCGNCTMVCPTCFCTTVEDHSDLENRTAERVRKWDSCFTLDFSYIHGGSVRTTTHSRYRQWMTHKLANWIDQFGTSGCVGCGRCITWCPTGIDLTEEAAAIRAAPSKADAQ
ncbi:MAG: 4Fe-4S dicluster domain-containing protein [Novosphingobium sp.]|nr:4Fe-4S dicluster domain-containing protein [Novosphingobium sp.]MCB2077528.1 4Fe-4S dicluster domain-containing protein [Novosphingobium sp.]